jgi:site-specific DNA-methyltransferase (adenine-specific)
MTADMLRLPLPEPSDDGHPLDWFPEPDLEPKGLPGVLTETSYTLPEELNLGEWLQIGETLQRMERSVQWWLGDWWNYGDRKYGEMASQASRDAIRDATGHAYNTVRQAGYVASRFQLDERSSDVSWSHHLVVADLPKQEAEALIVEAHDEGLSVRDLRDKAKERKNVIAVEAALSQPAPSPLYVPRNVRIEVGDAVALPLDDESVHLIPTSPPYGVDLSGYEGGEDVLAGDWPSFMLAWLAEAFRVTVEHGRLALNIPLDTTRGGFRPTYAQAVQLAEGAGWEYRSTILWVDDQLGKSTARGSMDSAAAPHVIAGAEMIALFSKGAWRREPPSPAVAGDPSWLQHDEWIDWTNGVWKFPGETQAWEGHPAPFPLTLPHRLIKLLSFPGDVVLDPFCGSGTTALAANRLGRDFIGFDRSQKYVDSALRRVVKKGQAA